MTTERLRILAAAAALGEFTTPELAAYTGARAGTLRRVLSDEQDRGRFECAVPDQGHGNDRLVVWRLTDADAVLDEIADDGGESRIFSWEGPVGLDKAMVDIAERRGIIGIGPQESSQEPSTDRTDALLSSAEDAADRCREASDPAERRTLAAIAMNLLHAAKPDPQAADIEGTRLDWWERSAEISRGLGDQGKEGANERARRIAAFTALAAGYRRVIASFRRRMGAWELVLAPLGPPSLAPSWLSPGEDDEPAGTGSQASQAPPSPDQFHLESATPLNPARLQVRLGPEHAGRLVVLLVAEEARDDQPVASVTLDEQGAGSLTLPAGGPPLEVVLADT